MTLSGTTVTWRGLTFDGSAAGDFGITTLDGWEELPPERRESNPRPQAHGRFDAPVFSDERTVTLTGSCYSPTRRDELLVQLGNVMTWLSGAGATEPLVIDHAGRVLTGHARLTRYKPTIGQGWAAGHFPYAVEWVCADPLRYGLVTSAPTGFPTAAGGLQFPLYTNRTIRLGVLSYGARSTTGRLVIANPGNADMWPLWQVAGPVPAQGFEIVRTDTGDRIRFEAGISAGSTLVMDSATGVVLIDGYADRSGSLTWRDWSSVAPGTSAEFAFTNLGSISSAQLTATTTPGWW